MNKIVRALLWALTICGALTGSIVLAIGLSIAEGSPQEAAAGAIAACFAIIPYCIARAASEIVALDAQPTKT